MVPQRLRSLNARGVGLAELMVVMAIFAIIAGISIPFFVSYWRSSRLEAGARELQAALNSARQLAIRQNTNTCVERVGTQVRYRTGGCAGTIWTGAGTDGNGLITLGNGIQVSGSTANVVFTYLGAASTAGTYTVTNPQDTATLTVTVATSGRVTIP